MPPLVQAPRVVRGRAVAVVSTFEARIGERVVAVHDVPAPLEPAAHMLLAFLEHIARADATALDREICGARLGTATLLVSVGHDGVVRDPGDASAPYPRAALETILLDQALASGRERALLAARESVARWPGTPSVARHRYGPDHDHENALAHRALAWLEPDRGVAERAYAAALDRSAVLALFALGDWPTHVQETTFQHVAELSRFVVHHTLRAGAECGDGVRSPVWALDGASGRVGRVSVPARVRSLDTYYRGEAERVLRSPLASELTVEAITRHRSAPTALAGRLVIAERAWAPLVAPPAEPTKLPFVPLARLCSLVLAAIGLGVAAGLERDALRAWITGKASLDAASAAALDALDAALRR
jgi:hypothetical protein